LSPSPLGGGVGPCEMMFPPLSPSPLGGGVGPCEMMFPPLSPSPLGGGVGPCESSWRLLPYVRALNVSAKTITAQIVPHSTNELRSFLIPTPFPSASPLALGHHYHMAKSFTLDLT